MKKWLTHCTIFAYLTALGGGILSHTVSYGTGSHPVMYYFVWDMFCGWSSYSSRIMIIGEGESGKYYELAPGPWGEYRPFGSIGRRHYDSTGSHSPKFALNAIKQTKHEPITRVFVIEQCWAKKYNLPDHLWNQRFEKPKKVHKYHHVLHVFTPDGVLVQSFPNWLSQQYAYAVGNNPRLMREQRQGQPYFTLNYRNRSRGSYAPGGSYNPESQGQVGSRLGKGN